MAVFNEDTRVKIPATIQFMRNGYEYQSLKDVDLHQETRIAMNRFMPAISRLNGKQYTPAEALAIVEEIHAVIKNNDLGKAFYQWLINPQDKPRLVDFENPANNDFAVVCELTFGKDGAESDKAGSFRPDITILINGIPLAFLEVKHPNNEGGIQAEFNRMLNKRLEKPEYKKYFNMLQIVSFSNNMEYESDDDTAFAEDVKAGLSCIYMMVLGEHKQFYIGQTSNLTNRMYQHWTKNKELWRLVFGPTLTSILLIDSYRALDTTKIYFIPVAGDKLFELENRITCYAMDHHFGRFMINRVMGGDATIDAMWRNDNDRFNSVITEDDRAEDAVIAKLWADAQYEYYRSSPKNIPSSELASRYPSLAAQWHPTKNGQLTPQDVDIDADCGTAFWWLGPCGHEWSDTIAGCRWRQYRDDGTDGDAYNMRGK